MRTGLVALALSIIALIALVALWLQVAGLEKKVGELGSTLQGVQRGVDDLSKKVGQLSNSTSRLANATKSLEERVKKLEAKARAEKEIVVVPVDFVISDYSVDFLIQYVKRLEFDNKTAGVVVLINSPGGAVGATERLYTVLRGLNKTKYAVISGLGASGGYYVAMSAERVYATPSSWVGSVGVIATIWPEEYLIEVPDFIYTTGPLKYYGRDLPALYNDVEKFRENFVDVVVKSRGARLKDLERVEAAEIFRADEALQLGLVDKLGGLWDAVRDMAEELGLKNYTVVDIYEKYNVSRWTTIVIPLFQGKVALKALLNMSSLPIFYMYPGAVQLPDGHLNITTPPPMPAPQGRPRKPYVVLDMSHGNALGFSFVEPLAALIVARGYELRTVTSEAELVEALKNATGLVVANPTAPFSTQALEAVVNATRRGVRVLYLADSKATSLTYYGPIIIVAPVFAPANVHNLLMYFNASIIPRGVFNASALGAKTFERNWQFVHVQVGEVGNFTKGVKRLVLYSPTPVVTTAGVKIDVVGDVRGYGRDSYTIFFNVGNFTYVGSMRSFTPYFIALGDNKKFLQNLVDWLLEPRRIEPVVEAQQPQPPILPPYITTPPIPQR
ncbi:MAG: S49 family peptidase [Pyrobaculum sp.]